MIALMALMACFYLPRSVEPAQTRVAAHKPDFSASGIDPMPVGTAKQMARIKRNRTERKA